jgi:hypothetical protein
MKGRLFAFGGLWDLVRSGLDPGKRYWFSEKDHARPASWNAMTLQPEAIAIEVKETLTTAGVVSSYDNDDGL